jgi:hypothetical protein
MKTIWTYEKPATITLILLTLCIVILLASSVMGADLTGQSYTQITPEMDICTAEFSTELERNRIDFTCLDIGISLRGIWRLEGDILTISDGWPAPCCDTPVFVGSVSSNGEIIHGADILGNERTFTRNGSPE